MDTRDTLLRMLQNLLKEMDYVQSQGAGYFTCVPFARRYNKLKDQTARFLGDDNSIMQTFESLEERDPKDPGEKFKVLLGIRIEISQLITLLESAPQTGEADQC